jgi:hypothetical protein
MGRILQVGISQRFALPLWLEWIHAVLLLVLNSTVMVSGNVHCANSSTYGAGICVLTFFDSSASLCPCMQRDRSFNTDLKIKNTSITITNYNVRVCVCTVHYIM